MLEPPSRRRELAPDLAKLERLGGGRPFVRTVVEELRVAAERIGDADSHGVARRALERALALAARHAESFPADETRLRFFAALFDAAREVVSRAAGPPLAHQLDRVVRVDEDAYALPCGRCNFPSAIVVRGASGAWTYAGLVTIRSLPITTAALLVDGQLRALHGLAPGGLDAYCPHCDASYCEIHYGVKPFMNYGVSEGMRGTCPRGHERELYVSYWSPYRDD